MVRVEFPSPRAGAIGDLGVSAAEAQFYGKICYFGPLAFISGEFHSKTEELRLKSVPVLRRVIAEQLGVEHRRVAMFCSRKLFATLQPLANSWYRLDYGMQNAILATLYGALVFSVFLLAHWLDRITHLIGLGS